MFHQYALDNKYLDFLKTICKSKISYKKNPIEWGFSDRDTIRTCDRLLRRQMLYPAELRDLDYSIFLFQEDSNL